MTDPSASAFVTTGEESRGCDGLTKREMFAMAAMQGLCADTNTSLEKIPANAVQIADDLIAELNK